MKALPLDWLTTALQKSRSNTGLVWARASRSPLPAVLAAAFVLHAAASFGQTPKYRASFETRPWPAGWSHGENAPTRIKVERIDQAASNEVRVEVRLIWSDSPNAVQPTDQPAAVTQKMGSYGRALNGGQKEVTVGVFDIQAVLAPGDTRKTMQIAVVVFEKTGSGYATTPGNSIAVAEVWCVWQDLTLTTGPGIVPGASPKSIGAVDGTLTLWLNPPSAYSAWSTVPYQARLLVGSTTLGGPLDLPRDNGVLRYGTASTAPITLASASLALGNPTFPPGNSTLVVRLSRPECASNPSCSNGIYPNELSTPDITIAGCAAPDPPSGLGVAGEPAPAPGQHIVSWTNRPGITGSTLLVVRPDLTQDVFQLDAATTSKSYDFAGGAYTIKVRSWAWCGTPASSLPAYSSWTEKTVTVQACPLTCSATVTPSSGPAPHVVAFQATASGCPGTPSYDWSFGDGASSTQASGTHSYATPGVFPWQMTASASGVTCRKSGTVDASVAPPIGSAGSHVVLVPSAARSAGVGGSRWVSELVVHNPNPSPAIANLYFLKQGRDNTTTAGIAVAVPANSSRRMANVVETIFGETATSGAILVGSEAELLVTSRTFNDATTGTYGEYVEGYPVLQAIGPAQEVRLLQLTKNASYRTNIGFANATGQQLTVLVRVFTAEGTSVGSKSVTVPPWGYLQESNPINTMTTGDVDDAYAILSSATTGARYFAYASVIDNRTGDPVQVVPLRRRGTTASPSGHDLSSFQDEIDADAGALPPALPHRGDSDTRDIVPGRHDVMAGTDGVTTTPSAALGVARSSGMPGTPTCSPIHATAVKGFPGDTFTITNQSLWQASILQFKITYPDQSVQPLAFGQGNTVTWPSVMDPANGMPGEYAVYLQIYGTDQQTYETTTYIQLCDNPLARLALTHVRAPGGSWQSCSPTCPYSYLLGYSLRYSTTGSDGHPGFSADNPIWVPEFQARGSSTWEPSADPVQNNGDGSFDVVLQQPGEYRVSASVSYPFTQVPQYLGPYQAHSGAITASIQVKQGGVPIATGGSLLDSSSIEIKWTGQIASAVAGTTCDWKLDNSIMAGSGGSCTAPLTLPAGLLTAGPHTLSLTATSFPVVDSATASFSFTVVAATVDFTWSPATPSIGESVSLAATVTGGNVLNARWTFDMTGCTEPATINWSCPVSPCTPPTFHFKTGGSHSVTVAVLDAGGGTIGTQTKSITVNNSGSCTTSTAPSAPVLSSPANGATVSPGSVAFSWSASTGTAPITYAVYLGAVSMCSTSGTSCASTLVAGSYTWSVKATNAAGSATTAARSLTVGSSCTVPSSPVPTAPANGATVGTGQLVTFSWNASTGTAPIGYKVASGDGNPYAPDYCSNTTSLSCTWTPSTVGTNTWRVVASNACGTAGSATRSMTVQNVCQVPGAARTPVPANNATVLGGQVMLQWAAPSTGTGPFTYDVYFGSGVTLILVKSGLSATQWQVTANQDDQYNWYVVAKGCGGSTASPPHWTFRTCLAPAVPTADFSWEPSWPLTYGSVIQTQPYEGQTVTLHDASSNFPTAWDWTDFNAPLPWPHYYTRDVAYTWSYWGSRTVRLTATNCLGASTQVAKTITIAQDVRPVVARFTADPANPGAAELVTFTADNGDSYGNPTKFRWDFGDGTAAVETTNLSVSHRFDCGRTYAVKLVATRVKSNTVTSDPGQLSLVVGGQQCSPDAMVIADVTRNLPGANNAVWTTDVSLYNWTTGDMLLMLSLRCNKAAGTGTCPSGLLVSPAFLLRAQRSRTLEDVLTEVSPIWSGYQDWTKGSVWIFHTAQADWGKPLPVVSARTHTGAAPVYDDYGQIEAVYPAYLSGNQAKTTFVTGAQHNGKPAQTGGQGFRTNLTLLEPIGKPMSTGRVKLTLTKVDDPTFVKQATWVRAPWDYQQAPMWKLFEVAGLSENDDIGSFILKIELSEGTALAVGCSLVNNGSNAPVFVPAQVLPNSAALVVPDVARNLPGPNSSVWNTQLTLYNPTRDEMFLKLAVKKAGASTREESRSFSILPGETMTLDQVLSYVGIDFQQAALWFYLADPRMRGGAPLPLIAARTHTGAAPVYDDFGQFEGVYPVYLTGTHGKTLFITGAQHNGKAAQVAGQGFRTNLTLLEPAGTPLSAGKVKLTLTKVDDPAFVKQATWVRAPWDYQPAAIWKFFEAAGLTENDDLGSFILKIELSAGTELAIGCSMVNNGSNAPVYLPAQTPDASEPVTPCFYVTLPSPAASFDYRGGNGSFSIDTESSCGWAAVSGASWLTVTGGSPGTGSGTVTYSVSANGSMSSRSASISVTGQSHVVTQAGAPCAAPSTPTLSAPAIAAPGPTYSVTWTAAAGADSYELQESTDPAFPSPTGFPVTGTARSFAHTVQNATSYSYRVRAVATCLGAGVQSPWSEVVVTAVVPPDAVLYLPAAAHSTGVGGTNWRTDLEIHNPGTSAASYTLTLLAKDQDNGSPRSASYALPAQRSTRWTDVLQQVFAFTGSATLRVTPTSGEVMATGRTYNQLGSGNSQGFPEGSTFGQFVPAAAATASVPAGQSVRLVQLAQSANTTTGFRTNLGLVNATSGIVTVVVTLYLGDGTPLGEGSYTLRPYEFKQIDRVFTSVTGTDVPDGYAVLKTTTSGGAFFAYASVIDNRSGDPIYIPARVAGE